MLKLYRMKVFVSWFIFFTAIIVVSCGSTTTADIVPSQPGQFVEAPPVVVAAQAPIVVEAPVQPEAAVFDSGAVSEELYQVTLHELQDFIENLNQIIRSKNYEAWKAELAPGFFAGISDPVFLRRMSDSDAMKARKIVLRTPQDFFTNVVVPSRANSRVDDIEFISENRVKAFTVNKTRSGQVLRLRLYDLEHSGNIWKIID